MTEKKTFPISQPITESQRSVPWMVAEEAYKEYAAQYSARQSLSRLAERGGFGPAELARFLFERIERLKNVLTLADDAIINAIANEDGLDGKDGEWVRKQIRDVQ